MIVKLRSTVGVDRIAIDIILVELLFEDVVVDVNWLNIASEMIWLLWEEIVGFG